MIREFSAQLDNSELKWHTDAENRLVIPISENDWKIQLDNELPKPLNEAVYIPKNLYHRVIKGTTSLKVKIIKGK